MADEKTADKPIDKVELARLLQTPLDPNLDYFDATASIEAIAEHIRGLHKLIGFLANSLMQQGVSILDIREKMIEHKNAIELVADAVYGDDDDRRPSLIGFEEPKIVMPRKN